jgi:CubicO group peptidase (beta-lactamase class C family)
MKYRICLHTLLVLLTVTAIASAGDDRVVVEHAEAMVAAAQGDVAARQAFIETRLTPGIRERNGDERLLEILAMVGEDLGGAGTDVAITGFAPTADGGRVVLAPPDGTRLELVLHLSGETPRIDRFGLRSLPPEVAAVAPEQIPAAIEAHLSEAVAAGRFSGAVLVAQGDRVLFARGYGMADRGSERPNTLDTPINLGSMNKMFTAIAVAQLVAAGKLDWQDTVGMHLPDYPNATVRERVTIEQLLTHTSGVGSYWNEAYEANNGEIDTQAEFAATFAAEPLLFEPGAGNEYSNGGPVILGLVIEKLSGMNYYDYVRARVYAPAGMTRSAHYLSNDTAAGFAIGYEPTPGGKLEDNFGFLGLRGSAAGGGYASANDLLAFARALRDETLLSRAQLEALWQPRFGADDSFGYGYLFGTGRNHGLRWVGHSGGAPGISADFRYYPEEDITVVVLANLGDAARPVSGWVNALVSASLAESAP